MNLRLVQLLNQHVFIHKLKDVRFTINMEDALDVVAIMDLSTMSLLHHHLLEENPNKKHAKKTK